MLRFAAYAIKPDGGLPMIGDTMLDYDLRPYLGSSLELDFSISGGTVGSRPADDSVSFPASGYAFLRGGWGEERSFEMESFAAFDFGAASDGNGTHGHDDALSFLAQWHLDREEPTRALPYLRRLTALHPGDAALHFNVGLAARRAGRVEEARRHMKTFIELDPENGLADEVEAEFELCTIYE